MPTLITPVSPAQFRTGQCLYVGQFSAIADPISGSVFGDPQQAQIQQLLAASEALRQSEAIRALVDAMTATRGVDADETFFSWKHWALEQADRIDPRHADIGTFLRSFTSDDDDGG